MNPLELKDWESQTDRAWKSEDWQNLKYREAHRTVKSELIYNVLF